MGPTARRRIIKASFLAAGSALLAFIVSRYPLAAIGAEIRGLAPGVFAAPLIAFGWFVCNNTVTWKILDRAVPWSSLLRQRLVADGYNNLLPGGVLGEVFRVRQLSRWVSTARAVAATVVDRVVNDGLGLVYSAACVAIGLERYVTDGALRTALAVYIVAAAALGICACAIVLSGVPGRLGQRIGRWFGVTGAADDAEPRRVPPGTFVVSTGWIALGRALGVGEVALLLHLLAVPVDLGRCLFLHGALAAAAFVAFPVPAGIGVQEAATVYMFELMGQPGDLGLAFALARRGRLLFVALVGIALHPVGGRR